ncbi:glycoside hydrolase family 5 protein [Prevotella sp. 10(H)]|uniref:glycoside hydrolase family 5 protein n=1 Tax=Prevotella sp. 10(H) TaxID=1158294 RepID=UPI0004A72B4C|nr:glycoside hydrolase family 5 protein [Prevotella sp. 10(H)]
MKNSISSTLFAILLLFCSNCKQNESIQEQGSKWNPVQIHGQLQVRGRYLCNEKGDTISLRGVSFGWHNLWPRFYNEKTVSWLKNDWKCSVLRAAMGAYDGVEDGYLVNPEFALDCVEKVIKAGIKEDIYIIIDWHAHDFYPQQAKKFFASMARKYGKNPHIIYEIFNEPTHDHFWPEIKEYAEDVIAEIRKYDPNNIIIVGTPSWDQHVNIAAEDPIKGFDNIMYSFHFYAASHKDEHRERVKKALEKDLPIFVTESAGMEHTGDGVLNIEEWTKWIHFLEKESISWVNWSISNKNETCSMILPRGSYEGGWDTEVIKPAGRKSREFIRFYNTTDKVYENLR